MRSLIVHGGAWRIPDAKAEAHLAALRAALEKGRALVDAGASALEVVIEMVSLLEDDTTFRECRDPAPESGVELAMDAAVMDGASRRIGCCLRVRGVAHPVRLARAILEDGRAAVLAGPGASRFAGSVGIPATALRVEFMRRVA